MDALSTFARVVHLLLLSLWFGACVLFVVVLAPTAFDLLPSREVAGMLITATLQKIDLFGLVSGPILLATLIAGWAHVGVPLRLRALFTVIMTVAAAVSGRWLTPEMVRLRQAMGRKIEDVAASDPFKMEFTRLHTVSTAVMTVHVVLAFLLIVYAVSATSPKKKFGIEL